MFAWSEMSHEQRAWMLSRKGEPAVAKAMKVALDLDGEYRRAKIEATKNENTVAIQSFSGVVVKCAAGVARGARLGKSARALPMQFYGAHGIG